MPFTIELCEIHRMIKGLQQWFAVDPEFIQTIKEKTDNWEHEDCDECKSYDAARNKIKKLQEENQEWMRLRRAKKC